jgi:guanylate kinase
MSFGKLFLILGNSGVGKSTAIECVLKKINDLKFILSYTTRTPRVNEKEGIDYFFVSRDYFESLLRSGELLESDQPHGTYYYGIPKKPILDELKKGTSVIRTIAIKGLDQVVRSDFKQYIVSIFILPDENFDMRRKLLERDGRIGEERVLQVEQELRYADNCDYKIKSIQGKPELVCEELEKIIRRELKK